METSEHWDWTRLRNQCEREARRLLPDTHDAEDAVQEAMARAWRRRDRCRSPEAPLPWLLQITRNEAFRLLAKRPPAAEPVPGVADRFDEPRVDHEIEQLVLKVDVRRALERLPSTDRALASLRYGEDLAQPRIAALLDIPEGTIKVRLHRLRQKLRGDLSGTFESDYEPQ